MTAPEMSSDVIVIGGGLAGTTAARDLADAGLRVTLLEARERLGGRTYYRQLAGTDRKVEFGGTWIDLEMYPSVAREVERYALRTTESPVTERYISLLGGVRSEAGFPVPADQWIDFERATYAIIRDSHRIDANRPLDEQDLEDLDVSVTEYLDRLGIGPQAADYLRSWCLLTSAAPLDQTSMLFLLAFVAGLENSALRAVAVLATKFADGTISLIEAMLGESDVDVRLSSPVARVRQHDGGALVTCADGETLTARGVVVAAPVNCWEDIAFDPPLGEDKLRIAAERHPGVGYKLWMRLQGADGILLALNGAADQVDLALTEYRDPDGDWVVGFATQHEYLDVDDIGSLERAMKLFDDGLEVCEVAFHDWIDDPYSKGTWWAPRPGWLSSAHGALRRREGCLVFAGADVATKMPATIEAAVQSGGEAAAELLAALRADGALSSA